MGVRKTVELKRATALITGGASGLGEATASGFHAAGANVVIADYAADKGAALARKLGPRAVFALADVTVTEQLEAAVNCAADEFGRLDILVCCAGIGPAARILSKSGPHDIELYRKVIAINLVGTFDALRLAAAKMAGNSPNQEGERGVIINTGSIAGFEGQVGQAAYASSKAGIIGLTLCAARDLATFGIRVCTIAPGTFDTPLLAGISDDFRADLAKQIPFPPRLGRPIEYARLAQHIVENPMLNGETIRLDGALRMPAR